MAKRTTVDASGVREIIVPDARAAAVPASAKSPAQQRMERIGSGQPVAGMVKRTIAGVEWFCIVHDWPGLVVVHLDARKRPDGTIAPAPDLDTPAGYRAVLKAVLRHTFATSESDLTPYFSDEDAEIYAHSRDPKIIALNNGLMNTAIEINPSLIPTQGSKNPT